MLLRNGLNCYEIKLEKSKNLFLLSGYDRGGVYKIYNNKPSLGENHVSIFVYFKVFVRDCAGYNFPVIAFVGCLSEIAGRNLVGRILFVFNCCVFFDSEQKNKDKSDRILCNIFFNFLRSVDTYFAFSTKIRRISFYCKVVSKVA